MRNTHRSAVAQSHVAVTAFTSLRLLILTCACALGFIANLSRADAQEPNPDMYLELVEVRAAPANDETFSTDGQITFKSSDGTRAVDYFWNSPPKIIDASGFVLTLTIRGKVANFAESFVLRAQSTMLTWEAEPLLRFELQPGQGDSNSLTVSARPVFIPETLRGVTTSILFTGGAGGVEYRYVIKSRIDDPGPQAQLAASIDDCPGDIVISAYPPLNCHITISGFRHNTADEVVVSFPSELDTFGNHANGIQLSGRGSLSVYNMTDPYEWGLFIFACPSQPNAGMNCYDNVTSPGAVTVPITVSQANTGSVTVNLTLNAVSRGNTGIAGQVARIGNRAQDGNFINIETGPVVSSPIRADWLSALWEFEEVEDTEFVRLKSLWKPEIYLHTENGRLEAGTIQPAWESAMWQIESIAGTDYIRIRNRWRPDEYLNTESGVLQSSPADPNWLSASWWLLQ